MNSNYQTPEGKAREHIDKMLNDEGWNVVSIIGKTKCTFFQNEKYIF